MFGHKGEVIWEVVEENGTLYSQSYSGNYSTPGKEESRKKSSFFSGPTTKTEGGGVRARPLRKK